MQEPCELRVERPVDAAIADGLIERAFGPGRYAKAAERLREGSSSIRELSFIAWRGERAVGCVRLWPIAVGETRALLLGPFAVEEAERSAGVGAALIARACEAAAAAGHAVVLLVGDLSYFGPLGFAGTRDVRMPGPVDRCRVLARALTPGAADGLAGEVTIAPGPQPAPLALAAE
ncbi:MAG TPA: N-acetyltransferase [Caulobacteraceae bacterium]|jgi:predicted N-acetyltransferase YhbS